MQMMLETRTAERSSDPTRAEAVLITAVRAGDDHAFELLYARYRERIHAFILSKVRDHGRAEDLGQEVFISALRQLRASQAPIAFKPWIYTIARNACIDEFRRGVRSRELSMDTALELGTTASDSLLSTLPTPSAAAESRQSLEDLRGAFGGLSENQHRLIVMREFEGRSYDEIGDRLGMTRQMVESSLFRARRKLSEEYEELASGRRCCEVQSAIDEGRMASARSLGVKQRRRYGRHLSHCDPCRHFALTMGVDSALLERRSLASRVAALLPLPLLRRLWTFMRGGGGPGGAAGHSGAAATGAAGSAGAGTAGAAGAAGVGAAGVGTAGAGLGTAAAVAAIALAGAGGGFAIAEHGGTTHRSSASHVAHRATLARPPAPSDVLHRAVTGGLARSSGSRPSAGRAGATATSARGTDTTRGGLAGSPTRGSGSTGSSGAPGRSGGASGGMSGSGGSSSGTGSGGAAGVGKGGASGATSGVTSTLGGATDGVKTVAGTVTNGVKTVAGTATNGVKTIAGTATNGVKTVAGTVTNGVKTVAGTATNGVKTVAGTATNGVKTVAGTATNGVKTIAGTTTSGVKTIAGGVSTGSPTTVGSGVGTVVSGAAGGAGTTAAGAVGGAGSTAAGAVGGVGSTAAGAVGGVGTTASGAAGGVGTTLTGVTSATGTTLSGVAAGLGALGGR